MLCSITNTLTQEDISTLQNMEKETGKTLLAYSCHTASPASLSQEELNKLQELEKKLGVVLVAVDSTAREA